MMFSLTALSSDEASFQNWGGGEQPGRMDVAATAICKESDYESTREGRNLGAPITNSFIRMLFTLATM